MVEAIVRTLESALVVALEAELVTMFEGILLAAFETIFKTSFVVFFIAAFVDSWMLFLGFTIPLCDFCPSDKTVAYGTSSRFVLNDELFGVWYLVIFE
jgi:hypothetical protein